MVGREELDATSCESVREALVLFLDESAGHGHTASRQDILKVFLQLASREGLNDVSMRMIASELNIKAPSLYAHFPGGRDEIAKEALSNYFRHLGTEILEILDRADTPQELWSCLIRLHITRLHSSNSARLSPILVNSAHNVPSGISAQLEGWANLYERIHVAAATVLGYPDSEKRIKVIMTLLDGSTQWADPGLDENGLALLSERADLLSRTILRLDF
ncbi:MULTISPECIES: TetR/AcrR family transcriptional regulator [Arthrobacter]|uniref:TetR/AcrR family transcriptional regulator n=1 Tax=Arthrobacter terricola TaxID=2547396 RepID=A0A4R5JZY2_9MICC|nr:MULTISPECIES: TetR/AcrR family transcriptional regulator [Arthrobacter]MBT8163857.1 TetR/AcrR family transcriptional regulator [Arthrobacter sp. GN70]TDF83667.1 TetR/AcrR family transcriptional regulator [Arthrobacter terricola]